MNASRFDLVVITGLGAALVTAISSIFVAYGQRTNAIKNEHRLRAFERHLEHYERIFSTARSVQDSLRDYLAIRVKAKTDGDPMLRQLLEVLAVSANSYNAAVDWQHNSGMLYLDLKLEEHCLRVRDLLSQWLAQRRVTTGNEISIVTNSDSIVRFVNRGEVRRLRAGDYRELRIEEGVIVVAAPGDDQLAPRIDRALSQVISELKDVLAH